MAKEKNLTNVTSVAAADFVRLVTSAGASVKATAANLAKYIIETYNGSTVAGSAQTVKSALDSLNSKMPTLMGGEQVTITDTTNGYIDTGISSADYIIIAAYTLLNANNVCLISNLSGGNFRVQVMNATNQTIAKSGTFRIYYWVMPR